MKRVVEKRTELPLSDLGIYRLMWLVVAFYPVIFTVQVKKLTG